MQKRHKITVFFGTILILVTILGAAMYLVEGEENGFTRVPVGVSWAVVTMTTVGYGDITPQTLVGKTLAAFVMVLGYSVIAVPTGIVTDEIDGINLALRSLHASSRVSTAMNETPLAASWRQIALPMRP
jgi:voltage-gated potassium channel Kch